MWQKVCSTDQLETGGATTVQLGQKHIGVYHTEDGLHAIDNICPHMGAELHIGEVGNGMVYCPFHSWPFDLKNGRCGIHDKFNLEYYPVKSEDGHIWVDPESGQKAPAE